MTNPAPTDPLIGKTVSQYEVLAKLGGGGMGVVYKARDVKLGRAVALKFLPPQWSHDEGAKQRFMREAQAASATNHRNICVIHNIEETDDGRLFIVMACYEGETLKQRLERGALPVAEAIEIASEVAEGLAKAHAQGVVHRDVKPGNLMITDDGVKILDFGLAKFADALQLTVPGSTIGTVAYMSPEQARGEEADARSDVWALGVVMYEMLAGVVPFRGAYPEATFHAIKNEPVPTLRAVRPDVPEPLERIVMKGLEKDPAKRYPGAREPARDLRLLAGRTVPMDLRTEEVPTLGRFRGEPAGRTSRIRRAFTLGRVALLGLAAVVAAAGAYVWTTTPVVRVPVAVLPVANHTGESEIDAYRLALTATLIDELSESPNIRIVPYGRVLEIVRRFTSGTEDVSSREALRSIAGESGAQIVVVPTLVDRSGLWVTEVEFRSVATGTTAARYETTGIAASVRAETAYRSVIATAEGVQAYFRTNGPGRAYASRPATSRFRTFEAARHFERGLNAYERQEYAEARDGFRQSIAADGQQARSHAWLSRVLLLMAQEEESAAEGLAARRFVTDATSTSEAMWIEAVEAESRRDFARAEALYRDLARARPDEAWGRAELGAFLRRQPRNQDKDAIEAYHEVLRLDGSAVAPRTELCWLYARNGEGALAEEQARAAIAKARALGNRLGEAQALMCLGDALRLQGGSRLAEAREGGETARSIFESLGQPYGLSRADQALARIVGTARDYRTAIVLFESALTLSRQLGNRNLEGVTLMNLGVAHEALGEISKTLAYYEQSREFFQKMSDDRGAAQQDVNIALLRVTYGNDQDTALRRLEPARATLAKLGEINFEVAAMQAVALRDLYAGRLVEARRQLNAALSIARERKLGRAVELTTELARSHLLAGEYEQARSLLADLRETDGGRDDLEARIVLGQVWTRLGDLDAARGLLDTALADARATGQMRLAPLIHDSAGDLARDAGKLPDARAQYAAAAALWNDELPDAASVEARCSLDVLELEGGGVAAAARSLNASVLQADKMGRQHLADECRLQLARIQLRQRDFAQSLATLDTIAVAREAVGQDPELKIRVRYWRGEVMAARGDRASAETERSGAREMMRAFQASLPERSRAGFAARPDIRDVLVAPVQ